MVAPHRIANPFALMLDPQAVLAAVERSERLECLQRRVCRPLDRPLLAKVDGETDDEVDGDDAPAFDAAIDTSADVDAVRSS